MNIKRKGRRGEEGKRGGEGRGEEGRGAGRAGEGRREKEYRDTILNIKLH